MSIAFAVLHNDSCCGLNNLKKCTYFILLFSAPPVFTVLPISRGILDNERAMFHCQASGYPTPSMYWSKDGEGMITSTGRYINPFPNSHHLSHQLMFLGNVYCKQYEPRSDCTWQKYMLYVAEGSSGGVA